MMPRRTLAEHGHAPVLLDDWEGGGERMGGREDWAALT